MNRQQPTSTKFISFLQSVITSLLTRLAYTHIKTTTVQNTSCRCSAAEGSFADVSFNNPQHTIMPLENGATTHTYLVHHRHTYLTTMNVAVGSLCYLDQRLLINTRNGVIWLPSAFQTILTITSCLSSSLSVQGWQKLRKSEEARLGRSRPHNLCFPRFQCWCPPQYGTHSLLAYALVLHHILSIIFLKPTVLIRPSVPPSGSHKCLRPLVDTVFTTKDFIYLHTYLLT